jgi:NRE family putative nickel resistance protein-like MFS transporter
MQQYVRVLRANPDFARLWLANVISLAGDWFNTIVLSAVIIRNNPGSEGTAISLLLLARFLPPMLLSPVAGVLIDRFDRKRLLIWSNLLRVAVVLAMIPVLNNPDLVGFIYLLTILQFSLGSVFEPGQAALINNVVKPDDLVAANTLFSITWSAMLAFGSAIGGVFAVSFGEEAALLFDALTFLAGAWCIWLINGYQFGGNTHTTHSESGLTGIREGLRYLRRRPDLAPVLLVKFGGSLGNVDALMAIYATQIFIVGDGGKLSLGIMYSAFGVGAVLGPLLLNRFNDDSIPRMRVLIAAGFVFSTLGWLVMGAASSLLILCLALLIRAMGGSSNWTYSTVIIQKSAEDQYMGRVFSLDMMGFYLATVISTVIHGALIDLVGSQQVYLVALGTMGVALVPLTLWTLWTRRINQQPAVIMQPTGD